MATMNSELIKNYITLDPSGKVRQFLMITKCFVKAHEILPTSVPASRLVSLAGVYNAAAAAKSASQRVVFRFGDSMASQLATELLTAVREDRPVAPPNIPLWFGTSLVLPIVPSIEFHTRTCSACIAL